MEGPETRSGEQASEELEEERAPFERGSGGDDVENEGNPSDTSPTEMTGSAEPGTTATPEGTPEVSD